MIELKHVSKSFGSKKVLADVSLEIPLGQRLFVLGRSGMGKSVLLKHLVGLIRPDSGEIWIDGKEISHLSEAELGATRKKCGMIFQFPALLDSLSVYDNVSFGLRSHQMCDSEKAIEEKVAEKLELVGLSSTLFDRFPSELSFSIQKRVSIARTLAVEPQYLLFDEPTTGMDPVITGYLNELILDLSRRFKVTCIVVSHDLPSAFKVAERLVLLDHGELVFDGSRDAFEQSHVPLARDFLSEEVFA